jgi:hypothetical protein
MLATTPDMVDFMFARGANNQAKLTGAQIAQGFVCNNRNKDLVGMLQVLITRGLDIGGTTSRDASVFVSSRVLHYAPTCPHLHSNPFLGSPVIDKGG